MNGRTLAAVVAVVGGALAAPATAQVKSSWTKWHEIEMVYQAGKNQEALQRFRAFVDQFPTGDYADNSLWYISEIYYARLKKYPEVVKVCEELIKRYPGSTYADDACIRIAEVYYRQKKYRERVEILLSMEDRFPNCDRRAYALSRASATCYDNLRDYEQTAEIAMRVAEKFPASGYATEAVNRAGYAYRYLKRYEEAAKAFDLAAQRSDVYGKRLRADMLYEAAATYRSYLKKCDRAEDLFRQAVECQPEGYRADDALAAIGDMKMYTTRDYPGAVAVYEELLERLPHSDLSDGAAFKLSEICMYRLKPVDYEKACKYCEVVFEGYPQSEYADNCLYRYADIQCHRLKNYDKAIEVSRRLLEKHPDSEYAESTQKLLEKAQKAAGQ